MAAIDKALAAINALEPGEKLVYQHFATKFGVDRSTLSRRHKRAQQPRETKDINQQRLNPQQEIELVKYIELLTTRHLPPTREMIQNFASPIAQKPVSESWVTRFINRHSIHLISRYSTGMDRQRHDADSYDKYKLYFDLLQHKISEYSIESCHTYNMDEKGFMIGVTGRTKHVFSKRMWMKGEVTASIQDGNRDWQTLIACVCADGSVLPPGLIYKSKKSEVKSDWVAEIKPGVHSVMVTASASGWSNGDIGLAWLEQVFNRYTKEKARRKWRLLILDGHGSHVTMDFINYCDNNKILLAVLPPHSTQTLQPLDVVLFKPLSTAYSKAVTTHIHEAQNKAPITRADFFRLFYQAWMCSFTEKLILKSFDATGIHPLNPDVILSRFVKTPEDSDSGSTSSSVFSNEDWLKMETLLRRVARDESSRDAKKMRRSIHHISVQASLLQHEITGLKKTLKTQKKHKKKNKALDLQQRQEYHGGAVFWSPSKISEARFRERVRKQEEKDEALRKATNKEVAAAKKLVKEKEKEEKRVAREVAKEVREKEKAEAAIQKAEKQAEKQRQKEESDAAKAIQQPQLGKRKALEEEPPKKRQKRCHNSGVDRGGLPAPPPAPPLKTTTRGRNVKLPAKFR